MTGEADARGRSLVSTLQMYTKEISRVIFAKSCDCANVVQNLKLAIVPCTSPKDIKFKQMSKKYTSDAKFGV